MDSKVIEAENNIIESFNNCWRALARQYSNDPSEVLQYTSNMLAKIIGKVETEVKARRNRDNQMSIDEWLAWFESEAG